jgi:hypothetical protein
VTRVGSGYEKFNFKSACEHGLGAGDFGSASWWQGKKCQASEGARAWQGEVSKVSAKDTQMSRHIASDGNVLISTAKQEGILHSF